MATLVFKEAVANSSPTEAGFSMEGGKVRGIFLLQDNPTAADLETAITQILGDVSTSVGDGRLKRTLPVACPVYPWTYAQAITSIKGIGRPTATNANSKLEAATIDTQFPLYPQYQLAVEFTSRPYAVTKNATIQLKKSQTWYDETDTPQTYKYATEWDRYCDWEQEPLNNVLTAQLGQYTYRTQTGTAPQSYPFAAMPRLRLPENLIRFTWHQVPYRYIESGNSYIDKYQGYINQNYWNGYDAGELLYLSYKPKRYTPPVPKLDQLTPGVYSTEKWCNIEFTFLRRNVTGTDLPQGTLVTNRADLDDANRNYVIAGHNLAPYWPTRKWYYVKADATGGAPMWLSFPFELLFTDPDA